MTHLVNPPIALLGIADHKGNLVIDGLGTFTVQDTAGLQSLVSQARCTLLDQLTELGLAAVDTQVKQVA